MKLHPAFSISEEHSAALLSLLDQTVLGTNGARYRHLDTQEKVEECDRLLHLTLRRSERILGNISCCRREQNWYIRYFAFAESAQSSGAKKSSRDGLLKQELERFFDGVLRGEMGEEVKTFYAYIDPKNTRSLWMSEHFGFTSIAKICTQSFSRLRPKHQAGIERIDDWTSVQAQILRQYENCPFFTDVQVRKGPFYVLRDPNDEIIAGARYYRANWEIQRLPGKWGRMLTQLIPWIPGIRKIFKPKNHTFLVPEAVFANEHNPALIESLFEGMLAAEKEHLLLWLTDERNPVYQTTQSKIKWGIAHRFVGVHQAEVVVRGENPPKDTFTYCVGLDFI